MNIQTPKRWRKGQTIFNFLWWLQQEKGYKTEVVNFAPAGQIVHAEGRMADPFNIADADLDKLYEEFLSTHKN